MTLPLQLAVRQGDAVQTKELLAAGADPNVRDPDTQRTALEVASLVAQYPAKIADILHEHGANVNETDDEGWTLLHHATFRGRIREVRWLLQKEADTDKVSQGRRNLDGILFTLVTPLQIAASSRHFHALACLDELLKAGAQTDPIVDQGYGAIHIAARCGSCPAVAMLLAAGARLDHSNNPKRTTPLQEAIAHEQLDVLRYLLCLEAESIYQKIGSCDPYSLAEERRQVEDVPQGSPTQKPIRGEMWRLVKDASGHALYRYRSNSDPKCIGVGPISYVPKSVRRFNRGEANGKDQSNLPLRREVDDGRVSFEFGGISTVSVNSSSASSDLSGSQLEWLRSSPGGLQQTQDSDSDVSEDIAPKRPTSQPQEAPDSTPFDENQLAKGASIDTLSPTMAPVTDKHDEPQSQWNFDMCEPQSCEPLYQHASVQQSQEDSSESQMGTMLIGMAL